MKRITFARLAVLMLAVAGLVLQGCGGDDGVSPSTHNDLQDMYDALKADHDALVAKVGVMDDAADMDGSLYAQINHYMAQAGSLMTQIGAMDDAADMDGSLYAQINYYMDQGNMYMGMIGSMDDEASNAEGATLHAQINYHMGQASMYMGMIGSMDDEADDSEDASLYAQLKAAKARIAALEGGTAPDVLDPIKTAASDAADAADEAYMAADEAADEAETAAMNRATIQTGDANSVADAMDARMYADMAMTEAGNAKDASDMAQDAMDVATATPHKDAAEAAQEAAEDAQMKAEGARDMAKMDAMDEVKIDGSTKSVGDTSITINRQSRTSSDGRTITGLLSGMNVMQTGLRDANGHLVAAADGTAVAGVGATATVDVGVTYDSADDDARVTLVHSYLGTAKEMQFARSTATASTVTDSPFDAVPTATALTPEPPDPAGAVDTIPTGSVEVVYAQANAALGIATGAANELTDPGEGSRTATRTETGVAGIPRPAGVIAKAFDDLEGTQPTLYYIDTGVADVSVGADDDGIDQTRAC